ncbi:MAG: glycosyltransferase family 4 protein [Synechococcaceae cyanobacterium SM2_3_1]|nr:glycosyltransferase family 4 protein [Synechococcaceae cyanobacterium SM2_3_1]
MIPASGLKKILVISLQISPRYWGYRDIGRILCHELASLGYHVTVLTVSGPKGIDEYAKDVVVLRKPSLADSLKVMLEADVVFHNNISLSLGWLGFLLLKPQVIRHATWINDPQVFSITSFIKTTFLHRAYNIANSLAIAQHLPVHSIVIGNPYDAVLFRVFDNIPRDRDLIFVGRLVSDKGVDLLLQALATLVNIGLHPSTTIVGGGPEEDNLKKMTQDLGLEGLVHFIGFLQGEELVEILNAHRILVVPSQWREPFGIVALEGIACGCAVVGSEGGGLKDAIGPCGLTFQNGDVEGLARCLERLLRDSALITTYLAAAHLHLQAHHPRSVVQKYLQVMEAAYLRRPLPAGSSSES